MTKLPSFLVPGFLQRNAYAFKDKGRLEWQDLASLVMGKAITSCVKDGFCTPALLLLAAVPLGTWGRGPGEQPQAPPCLIRGISFLKPEPFQVTAG
jgi:hypothetical protein